MAAELAVNVGMIHFRLKNIKNSDIMGLTQSKEGRER